MSWATLEEARDHWGDAPLDDVVLQRLLDAAHEQCVAYAPTLADTDPVPQNYVLAEIRQARALGAVLDANADGQIGPDGYPVPVFPMDWNVKNLLRPRRGVPQIG